MHDLARLSFPTITATMSPLQVLPQFVEVLGKKMDKIRQEQDCRWIETRLHFRSAWLQ